jgi:hypothetical protein
VDKRTSGTVDELPSGSFRAGYRAPDGRRHAKVFGTRADAWPGWPRSRRTCSARPGGLRPLLGGQSVTTPRTTSPVTTCARSRGPPCGGPALYAASFELVSSVFDRISAMPAIVELLPRKPAVGSAFGTDDAQASSTYTIVRGLLVEAVRGLLVAGETAQRRDLAAVGTHILLLRPSLVSTAKAAWVARAQESGERVSRAARLVAEDRQNGANALRKAAEHGAPTLFKAVANAFERSSAAFTSAARGHVPLSNKRPPRDEDLILELGADIDRYYGTDDGTADVQLLWNASSSLAHGERWYASLTSGRRRAEIAEIIAMRSLDVVCSGLNVTALGVVSLAAGDAKR